MRIFFFYHSVQALMKLCISVDFCCSLTFDVGLLCLFFLHTQCFFSVFLSRQRDCESVLSISLQLWNIQVLFCEDHVRSVCFCLPLPLPLWCPHISTVLLHCFTYRTHTSWCWPVAGVSLSLLNIIDFSPSSFRTLTPTERSNSPELSVFIDRLSYWSTFAMLTLFIFIRVDHNVGALRSLFFGSHQVMWMANISEWRNVYINLISCIFCSTLNKAWIFSSFFFFLFFSWEHLKVLFHAAFTFGLLAGGFVRLTVIQKYKAVVKQYVWW